MHPHRDFSGRCPIDTSSVYSAAARLIERLQEPSRFDHPVSEIEVLQTHISWIVLTGEYAYKIKKPVNFGFVDFETLEKREHFCREELRLNSRAAPNLYLDVVPITGSIDDPAVGGSGPAIDFAVKMRQFPQQALLSSQLAAGTLDDAVIEQLADEVARFHTAAARVKPGRPFGSPEAVWKPLADNFEALENLEEFRTLGDELSDWSRAEFERLRDVFAKRKRDGFVRECHGDLHLGNILYWNDRVLLFDGIEFNETLHWIDVMSDLAFAVMDVEDRGRFDLSRLLLNRYLERTGDYAGVRVLTYYLVYRATVRAKVAALRLRQGDLEDSERHALHEECEAYLSLSQEYTTSRRPVLLLNHGVSGSGKSYGSMPLIRELGAIRVRSDLERMRLYDESRAAQRYSAAANRDTYQRLAEIAETVLQAGFPVIVDATFLRRRNRMEFQKLAERLGVPFLILDFHAREETLRERIRNRLSRHEDPSEATLDVLEGQLKTAEPLGKEEASQTLRIDTEAPDALEQLAARVIEKLPDSAPGGERADPHTL